jgi:hypothetical protein
MGVLASANRGGDRGTGILDGCCTHGLASSAGGIEIGRLVLQMQTGHRTLSLNPVFDYKCSITKDEPKRDELKHC